MYFYKEKCLIWHYYKVNFFKSVFKWKKHNNGLPSLSCKNSFLKYFI